MQKLKLLVAFALIISVSSASAQKLKPAFKSLLYITYDYDEATNKADIRTIIEINAEGRLHLRDKWGDGIADTSYRLADTSIAKLNKFFNGKRPLKDYMATDRMPPGMHQANPLEYIVYIDQKGNAYPFTVVGSFMNTDFEEAINQIYQNPSKIAYKGKTLNTPAYLKQLLDTQRKATYVPKIEDPPPVM